MDLKQVYILTNKIIRRSYKVLCKCPNHLSNIIFNNSNSRPIVGSYSVENIDSLSFLFSFLFNLIYHPEIMDACIKILFTGNFTTEKFDTRALFLIDN